MNKPARICVGETVSSFVSIRGTDYVSMMKQVEQLKEEGYEYLFGTLHPPSEVSKRKRYSFVGMAKTVNKRDEWI